jgi:hypothetical protein
LELSPVTTVSIIITILYSILLLWGVWGGVRQVYQGFRQPQKLLNPLFANRNALIIFTVHLIIVSLDLFICGPLALQYKSKLWYWGGRIALLIASLPLAFYFNRLSQSFGKIIGIWGGIRNIFEIAMHILVGAIAINWFYYYGLLYWLVAYRYLDVGPRRFFQALYNTPEKLAKRPWGPALNLVAIISIYVFTAIAIYYRKVIYLTPPDDAMPEHVASSFEWGLVVTLNVAIAMLFGGLMRRYTGPGPGAELIPHTETKAAAGNLE